MKKRGLCIALCLCLLTGALPALAQDGGALRVLNDGWFVSEDYLAQYPDRSLELIPAEYLDNGIDTNLRELISPPIGMWPASRRTSSPFGR